MYSINISDSLLCCSIALNAYEFNSLCAGGMFTFPLLSPGLAAQFKLSQPQLTTIALAGIMSQYTVAALVGSVVDSHGPSTCSLIGAFLFSCAFGAFAFEVHKAPLDLPGPSQTSFYRLVFCFFLAGLGTVFSYFSALFAASKGFPNHIGLASGTTMALFGLSPLFLSIVATNFFTDPTTGLLNIPQFMGFLALLTGSVYILGFINLRGLNHSIDEVQITPEAVEENIPQETSPLLAPTSGDRLTTQASDPSAMELVHRIDFWLLMAFCVLILGTCEMVISNIGTIVMAVPSSSARWLSEQLIGGSPAAYQVKLLSISNTVTRIVVGLIADFVSPAATYLPTGEIVFQREPRISRFVFLSGSASLLSLTSLWMAVGAKTREQVWPLSVGTGIGYSAVFTVLPSIISSLWGMQHHARNFGLMMYAPFTGTPLFSYIYAFISASHYQRGENICHGRHCWQFTFSLTFITSIIALLISVILWRRRQDRT
ncbi:MFS general substrate transporter [Phlegmacium glaucopus]|nr:MFS general substrate transporter [Phlegmacium glaucopus]